MILLAIDKDTELLLRDAVNKQIGTLEKDLFYTELLEQTAGKLLERPSESIRKELEKLEDLLNSLDD